MTGRAASEGRADVGALEHALRIATRLAVARLHQTHRAIGTMPVMTP